MKEQEIIGITENLLFYYPNGNDELHAQRYNRKTDAVISEEIMCSQAEYDMTLEVFKFFNNPFALACMINMEYPIKDLVD